MLFERSQWPALADGSITVAFRRWRRPTVRAGGTLQSPVGVLAIDEVAVIGPSDITADDARAAGFDAPDAVLGRLSPEGTLYRIRFHRVGDDPRVDLRQRTELDGAQDRTMLASVGRLAWATQTLRLIEQRPGVVSTELAAEQGLDRLTFKRRVRRLKELGLTESLAVGYRISPRGRSVLEHLAGGTSDEREA